MPRLLPRLAACCENAYISATPQWRRCIRRNGAAGERVPPGAAGRRRRAAADLQMLFLDNLVSPCPALGMLPWLVQAGKRSWHVKMSTQALYWPFWVRAG